MGDDAQVKIDEEISTLVEGVAEGEPLGPAHEAVLHFALSASAMALDASGAESWARTARERGVTDDQLTEAMILVSGMGVHSFFMTAPMLAEGVSEAFSPEKQELWDQYVGERKQWATMRRHVPNFLESLLHLSPAAFEAFFQYCAVPWKTSNLSVLTKELISAACDASPSHRYLPGMRMHLENAISLGAGRRQVCDTMRIASQGPAPQSVTE